MRSNGTTRHRRRTVLGAATAASCGLWLSACRDRARSPAPEPSAGEITITVTLDVSALLQYGTADQRARLYTEVLQDFEAKHPGLRVRQAPFVGTQANQAAIVAGAGPDVFPDCCAYESYVTGQLVHPLDAFVKADNLDLGIFAPRMAAWLQLPGGLYALPRQTDAYAFAVDLGALDDAGLAYPDPSWTYRDLQRLAQQLTVKTATKTRYGVVFITGGFGVLGEFLPGFGAAWTDATRTRQTLSTPEGIAAARWCVEQLFWPGFAGTGFFTDGTSAIQNLDMNYLLRLFTGWLSRKWVLLPPPAYPRGRSTLMAGNFWSMNVQTAHPQEAWLLLRWLTVDTVWQRFLTKTFLFPPCLNSLLGEWVTVVETVAPGLRNKGIQAYVDAATNGWAWVRDVHVLDAPVEMATIDGQWWAQLLARRVDVPTALRAMDQEVNAAEAAAPARSAARASAERRFPTTGPSVAPVPAGV